MLRKREHMESKPILEKYPKSEGNKLLEAKMHLTPICGTKHILSSQKNGDKINAMITMMTNVHDVRSALKIKYKC